MSSIDHFRQAVVNDAEALGDMLRQEYGIERLSVHRPGSWNVLFRGFDLTGRSYFVKVINDVTGAYRRRTTIYENVCSIVSSLCASGCRLTATPLRNREGRFVNAFCDLNVLVSNWIAHEERDQMHELVAQASEHIDIGANALAELHWRLAEIPAANWEDEVMPHVQAPSQWAARLDAHIHNLHGTLLVDNTDGASVATCLREFEMYASLFIKSHPALFSGAFDHSQWLHGDFRPENLVMANSRTPMVGDFDLMHRGSPLEDVAYGGLCFAGHKWFAGKRDWVAFDRFVDSYFARRHGYDVERDDVSQFVEWIVMRAITCSFKEEQLVYRMDLLREIRQRAGNV